MLPPDRDRDFRRARCRRSHDVVDNTHDFMATASTSELTDAVGWSRHRAGLTDNRDGSSPVVLRTEFASCHQLHAKRSKQVGLTTCSTAGVGACDDSRAAARSP